MDVRIGTLPWIEARVIVTAGLQPGDAAPGRAPSRSEAATDDNLAVGLKGDGIDHVVHRIQAGQEVGVLHAVRRQPGEEVGAPVEHTADQQPAIGLHGQGADGAAGGAEDGARIKGGIHGTAQVEAHQMIAGETVEQGEIAAGKELVVVRLHGNDVDRQIGPGVVEAVVRRSSRLLILGDGQHRGDDLAVGRSTHGIGQLEEDGPVAFHNDIVVDRHREGLVGLAIEEDKRGGRGGVIHPSHRRAAGHRADPDAHRTAHAEGADDVDDGVGFIFAHAVGRGGEAEQAGADIVIEDGDRRRRSRADDGAASGVEQCHAQTFRAFDDAVINQDDGGGLGAGVIGRPGEDVRSVDEIAPGQGRARHGAVADCDRAAGAELAGDLEIHNHAGLAHGDVGGREAEGSVGQRVVDDGERDGIRVAQHRAAGGRLQAQRHRLIRLRQDVGDDGHVEGLDRLAIGEGNLIGDRRVIEWCPRIPINGEVSDLHQARTAVRADDGDDGVRLVFVGAVFARAELQAARREVVIDQEQGRDAEADLRPGGDVRQEDQHAFGGFNQGVVDDGDEDALDRLAGDEGDGAADVRVIESGRRRALAGQVIHRHAGVSGAGADDEDFLVAGHHVFVHQVGGGHETDHAVIAQDDQAREREVAQGGSIGRILQDEIHIFIRLDDEVIQQGDREALEHFALGEGQRAGGRHIILPAGGGHINGRVIHRHASGGAARAADRYGHLHAIFHRAVGGGAEFHGARAGNRAAVEPREIVADLALHAGEAAADDELAIGLDQQGGDEAVGALAEVDGGIGLADAIQPGDAVARHVIEGGEVARHDDAAIRLQSHRQHRPVTSGGITRKEAWVEVAVQVEPGDVIAVRSVHARERATDEDAPVRLQGDGPHHVVRAEDRIEVRIQRAVAVQTRDARAREIVHLAEVTANDHLAIALDGHGIDRPVRTHAGIKDGVQRAIGVQHGHAGPRLAIDHGERSAHHDAPIRRQGHAIHRVVRATAGIEEDID